MKFAIVAPVHLDRFKNLTTARGAVERLANSIANLHFWPIALQRDSRDHLAFQIDNRV